MRVECGFCSVLELENLRENDLRFALIINSEMCGEDFDLHRSGVEENGRASTMTKRDSHYGVKEERKESLMAP